MNRACGQLLQYEKLQMTNWQITYENRNVMLDNEETDHVIIYFCKMSDAPEKQKL